MGTGGSRNSRGSSTPPFNRDDNYVHGGTHSFIGGLAGANTNGSVWYVDGTNGSTTNNGKGWSDAFSTISLAVAAASANDVIYIVPKLITDATGDPTSYAETIIIPFAKPGLSLIGISRGRTQGGLPQIKIGAGSTALLTIRAAGCLIANLGFNGIDSTGGGILLDDDNSTKTAFGTTIVGCHFKNCKAHSTNGALGGAITWSVEGNAWQVYIGGNRFFKNLCDICLIGTSNTVPQDVIIEDNVFSGPAAEVDVNLWLTGAGSGMNGVVIKNNTFQQLPAIGSGSVVRYIDATGCVGMLIGNTFGCQTNPTGGTTITFKAAGTGAKIPTTMHLVANYGQSINAAETGIITIA